MSRRPTIVVPAGTKATKCRRCRMSVYWVQRAGRPVLVDCSVIGGVAPSESKDERQLGLMGEEHVRDGLGCNHFDDCAPDGAA